VDLHNVPQEMPMYLLQEDEGNDDEIMRLLGTSNDATPTPSSGGDFHSNTSNEVDIMISPMYGDSQNEKEQDVGEEILSEEGSDTGDVLITEAAGVISDETLNNQTADQIDLVQELESNSSITGVDVVSPVHNLGSNAASESEPVDSNSMPCSSSPLPTSQDARILSLNGISEADTPPTGLIGDTVCHTQLYYSSRPPSKDQSPSHSNYDTSLSGVGANNSVSTVVDLRRKTPSVSWERRALMVNEGTQTLTWRLAGAAIATGGIDHLPLLPLQTMSAHDQAQFPNEQARTSQSPALLTTTQSPVLQQDVHKTKPLLSAPTTEVALQLSTSPTPSPAASSTFSEQTCASVPAVDSVELCDRIPISSSLQDITRTIPITEFPIPSSITAMPASLVTPTSTASSALMASRLAPPSTSRSLSPRSSASTTSGLSATTPSMASTTSSIATPTPSTQIPAPTRPTQRIVSSTHPAVPVLEHSLEALKQRVLLEAQKLDEALGSYQTQQASELVSAVQSPTHPQPVAMTTTPPVLPLKPSPQIATVIPSHSVATALCNTTTAGHTLPHTTTPNSAVHTLCTPLYTTTAGHTIPHTTTPNSAVHTLCTPLHTTTTSTATHIYDTFTNSTVHTLSTLHYTTTNATASGHQKSDVTNSRNVEPTTAPSPNISPPVTPAVSSTSPLPPSELPPLVITSVMSCANDDGGDVVCVNPSQEDSGAVVPERENTEQHPDQNMDVEMEPVAICEIDTESVRSLEKENEGTVEVDLDHVGEDTSDNLKQCVNDVETEQDDSPCSVASHQMDSQESASKDGELSQLSTATNNLHEARTQEPLELLTAPKSITVCFPVVDWRMKQICGGHMMGLSATPIQLLPTTNGLHPKQGGGDMHSGGEMKEERERKKVRVVHVVTSKLGL